MTGERVRGRGRRLSPLPRTALEKPSSRSHCSHRSQKNARLRLESLPNFHARFVVQIPREVGSPACTLDAVQEIEQRLPVRVAQRLKRRTRVGGLTAVCSNRIGDRAGAAVVQEMRAIRHSPQRHSPKFAAGRRALLNAVRKAGSHIV